MEFTNLKNNVYMFAVNVVNWIFVVIVLVKINCILKCMKHIHSSGKKWIKNCQHNIL